MKYIETSRVNKLDTIVKLDGVLKNSSSISINTALKIAGDKRYDGRIAARALYEEIACCEALLGEIDEDDRENALADVRALYDEDDDSLSRAMLGFIRDVLSY